MTAFPLPPVRGKIIENAPLAPYTWFRVGGPADALFLPADEEDLSAFLTALDPDVPVTVLGVGSNVIVRDGGIRGVVIRLMGKYWGMAQALDGITMEARAGALDLAVAKAAAQNGIRGLEFLSGIPGSIGGHRTAAGTPRRHAADQGKDVRLHLRQSRPAGHARPALRLEADRRGGLPGPESGRRAGLTQALQLPDQYRRRHRRRS